jgi:multiple antibiotic resistance protein
MSAVVHQLTHVFLLVYAGLFPIVNPVGNAPIFLALTAYCTDRERRALALRVAINGFFLLLGSLFVGSYVLEFFGITLPVLRIAGGVVVAAFGWTLLQAKEELADQRTAETARGPDTATDAFYPLTMPLTVGPGAMSVAIALGSTRPKEAADFAHLIVLAAVAYSRPRCRRYHDLCLLPFCRADRCRTWQARHQRGGAAFRLLTALHRHSNRLDWF